MALTSVGEPESINEPDPAWAHGLPPPVRFFVLVLTVGGTAVGLFALVYGLFFWPPTALLPWPAPVFTGAILLGGTVWGGLMLRRMFRRRATSIRLNASGVQLVLADGRSTVSSWNDPRFALDLVITVGQGADRAVQRSARWRFPPQAWANNVTQEGADRLVELARTNGLAVSEKTFGPRFPGSKTVMIRAPLAP